MELLFLLALGAGGLFLYRTSALAQVKTPVPVATAEDDGFLDLDIPFIGGELEEQIEEFLEEKVIAPVVDWVEGLGELSPEEVAKRASDDWVHVVRSHIWAEDFDQVVRDAPDDFGSGVSAMIVAIQHKYGWIPAAPDGSASGPNLDLVTQAIENRVSIVQAETRGEPAIAAIRYIWGVPVDWDVVPLPVVEEPVLTFEEQQLKWLQDWRAGESTFGWFG